MKTPQFIVQLHPRCLKNIYTLVLCKQTFIVEQLNTTREGFQKSVVLKMEKGELLYFISLFSVCCQALQH